MVPLYELHFPNLLSWQCPKLRVHPAPGAHIFTDRCMIFGGVFFENLSLLHIRGCIEKIPGAQF